MRTEERDPPPGGRPARLTPPPPTHPAALPPRLFYFLTAQPFFQKEEREREREKRRGRLPLELRRLAPCCCFSLDLSLSGRGLVSAVNHQPLSIPLAYSPLDLHENYQESKWFVCHIPSSQHILMITRCVWIFSQLFPVPVFSVPLLLRPPFFSSSPSSSSVGWKTNFAI